MNKLEESIKKDEGLRLKMYKDTKGIMTIGYGHNLMNGITEEIAEFILQSDINKAENGLISISYPWGKRLTTIKHDAIVELIFWIGVEGFLSFKKMVSALEAGNYYKASAELLDSQLGRNFPDRVNKLAKRISR